MKMRFGAIDCFRVLFTYLLYASSVFKYAHLRRQFINTTDACVFCSRVALAQRRFVLLL